MAVRAPRESGSNSEALSGFGGKKERPSTKTRKNARLPQRPGSDSFVWARQTRFDFVGRTDEKRVLARDRAPDK